MFWKISRPPADVVFATDEVSACDITRFADSVLSSGVTIIPGPASTMRTYSPTVSIPNVTESGVITGLFSLVATKRTFLV